MHLLWQRLEIERRPHIDPLFIAAVHRLARRGMPDAEIVRALQPLTASVGAAAPSYYAVRRIAALARGTQEPNAYVEEIVTKLLTGRLPDLYRAQIVQALRTGAGLERALERSKPPSGRARIPAP